MIKNNNLANSGDLVPRRLISLLENNPSAMNSESLCAICGEKPSTTVDHVPPRCLFSKPRPNDLITVPACLQCNQSTSQLDEEFRVFVSVFVGKRTPQSEHLWKTYTLPTVDHNYRLWKKTKDSFQHGYVKSKGGIILDEVELVVWDDSPKLVLDKIIRGLYYHHFNEILADKVNINVEQVQEMTETKADSVKSWLSNYVGDGQFLYRYCRANDKPLCSAWLLVFYKTLVVYAWTEAK